MNPKEKKMGILLFALGSIVVLAVLLKIGFEYRLEQRLLLNLTQQVKTAEVSNITSAKEELKKENQEDKNQEENQDIEKESQAVGIIGIPKIKLEAPIQEGLDKAILKSAIGHVPQTAMPGAESGNCALAGHRNYMFGRFFNRLDELEAGDLITISVLEGVTYYYEVTETFVVNPDEVWILEESKEPILTLITCTPIYIATHRLVIRAKLVP